MTRKQKRLLLRIIISAVLLALAKLLPAPWYIKTVLFFAAYVCAGYSSLIKAFKGIIRGRVCDENFLMAVATLGAVALAIYEKSHDYTEAVAVMLFYQVGEFFESYAVGKSRRSIGALMDIRPDYANIEIDGKIERVSPESVEIGKIIVIQPGERVPIDGVIEDGASSVNTAALTGESVPRDVRAGDEIISGCVNLSGVLRVRTSKEFGQSTVSKILELVELSGMRKSRQESFIARFSRIYTPVVCLMALAVGVLPPILGMIFGFDAPWSAWMYRALTFLVISCPCALVISVPLTFFAGLGGASRNGILVKGSNFMEALAKVRTVVFDKTGTLTRGEFEVSGVHHNIIEDKRILEYAALAECASSHPISLSLRRAHGAEIDRSRVNDIAELSGRGITANADGDNIAVGNERLMREIGVEPVPCRHAGTIIHVAINSEYAGHIVISDTVKPASREAISRLKLSGVKKTVMLTGDGEKTAAIVASEVGVDEYRAEMLPADKVAEVEKLLENGTLAFVGDGINDAPVLSRADVGIAMGALGSDAAIEAADVVLMDDDPAKIALAIKIARKCVRIVYENITFALGVKLVCMIISALGVGNMYFAVFADVGVMVLAVLNAMRALRSK